MSKITSGYESSKPMNMKLEITASEQNYSRERKLMIIYVIVLNILLV